MEAKPEQMEQKEVRRKPRSLIRRLLVLVLVMMAVALFVEVIRYQIREQRHQENMLLLKELDTRRVEQVNELLGRIKQAQEGGKVEEAEKLLRRVSVLDYDGKFTKEYHQLRQVQSGLETKEKQRTEKQRQQEVIGQWTISVQGKKVEQAEVLLPRLQEMGVPNEKMQEMRNQLEKLRRETQEERKKQVAREMAREKAVAVWLEKLRKVDTGKYNPEAMKLMEQALKEFPKEASLVSLAEKWQRYHKVLRVPGEYASIDEALPQLRDGDELILGEGVHYASVVVDKRLTITGAGAGKTVIEAGMKEGACMRFTKAASGSKLANLSLRGVAYLQGEKRYALLQVEADMKIQGVEVTRSAGHGVAILSGKVDLTGCMVHGNGWDGVSVVGRNAYAVIKNCRIYLNINHGVDFWNGAVGTVYRSEVAENAQCGVLVTGVKTRVTLAQLKVRSNRESGILIDSGARVNLSHLTCTVNGHSGVVVQGGGTHVQAESVVSSTNEEYGYIISPRSVCKGLAEDLEQAGVGNKLGLRADKGD